MRHSSWTTLASAALLAACAACTKSGDARESTPLPNVVTVTASDFAFQAPATIPAGLTTFRMVNRGPELHHVQLVKLEGGHTVQELTAGASLAGPPPPWVTFMGGPNASVPGAESQATLNLAPGSYALLCFVPSSDGVPHLMKGMVKPITVTPADARAFPVDEPDARITLRDYSYEIAPAIASGLRTIRVANHAEQPHEVILVRLAPGKTAADMTEWLHKMQGPPPGMPVGGTTLLSKGTANDVTADFEPGEYALLCMVPDARDGKPHVAHGMVRQITIR
ncbi:MAG: hypothetical protein ICV87_12785 [Gemmatimonadetes bacterium]|nr:hypothetical protein [Gemmatimonadota bacterium]